MAYSGMVEYNREGMLVMGAVERILEEVKRLSDEEKEAVLRALERERAADRFERAAGSWADFDADAFVAEIYSRRRGGERAVPEW